MRETREHYPELCVKAMKALLDMLQGQQPESMKQEPADVIGEFTIIIYKVGVTKYPQSTLCAVL